MRLRALHRAFAVPFVVALAPACSSPRTLAATATTSDTFQGSPDSAFCKFARESRAAFTSPGTDATPAQNKARYERLLPVLTQAAGIAPGVISQDFTVYVDAYRRFLGVLAAVNYDGTKVDQSQVQFLQGRSVAIASQRVTQYMQ